MVNHTHKHIHHDQSELIQFFCDKTIGVVRICNLANTGLKTILPWIQCEGLYSISGTAAYCFFFSFLQCPLISVPFAASWSRTLICQLQINESYGGF